MQGKVSIIIPSYNSYKYADRCLSSIFKQTYKNIEVIVVDDGSTDKSNLIYDRYKNNKNFILIKQKNKGPSAARNKGLEVSTGEFVFFVDIDDYIDEKCIEKLLYFYEKHNDKTIICTKHKTVSTDKCTAIEYNNIYDVNTFKLNIINGKIKGVVWGILFENKIIKQYNLKFDENTSLSEDTIFLFKYINYFLKLSYIDEYYYYYWKSQNSITNSKMNNKIKKNIVDLFYSIDKLNKITDYMYSYEFNKSLLRLLKYELNKLDSYKSFIDILTEKNINDSIYSFYKNNKLNSKEKISMIVLLYFKGIYYLCIKTKKKIKKIIKRS